MPYKSRADASRQRKIYDLLNPERRKACDRRYYAANKAKIRNRQLQARYGMSAEDWDSLFESQKRVCAICSSDTTVDARWHVDHDHATGKVRSILCHFCNLGLGSFKDNAQTLKLAAAYLEKHKP